MKYRVSFFRGRQFLIIIFLCVTFTLKQSTMAGKVVSFLMGQVDAQQVLDNVSQVPSRQWKRLVYLPNSRSDAPHSTRVGRRPSANARNTSDIHLAAKNTASPHGY